MNILEQIVADLQPALEQRKKLISQQELLTQIQGMPDTPSFAAAFRPERINVIAELKKASPSKGLIRSDFNFQECAVELEQAGAAALSVLTEPNYFRGNLEYLREVSSLVQIPLLCKDFIVDPYQICEARLHGASAILLIAALLPKEELQRLADFAASIGLEVLGEAHNEDELEMLLDCKIRLIGINARDLKTFVCDLPGVKKLLGQIPADRIAIAESAIRSRDELLSLRDAGARGFLIGETLMRAAQPGEKLKELI
ncbi:MAG: indole-3-glycerol phosphate synthase TrpC [Oligosphaeraceae bacterium]|nr:indole-3-glycerol phosphate synthase TrpC [Oligosphaeraceae bacterium]